jgi:DNA mismatch repair protein MutL
MACHSAVRAREPLTQEQMAALLEQRHLAQDTHHCPHGRPTALVFSKHDLERQFGRT